MAARASGDPATRDDLDNRPADLGQGRRRARGPRRGAARGGGPGRRPGAPPRSIGTSRLRGTLSTPGCTARRGRDRRRLARVPQSSLEIRPRHGPAPGRRRVLARLPGSRGGRTRSSSTPRSSPARAPAHWPPCGHSTICPGHEAGRSSATRFSSIPIRRTSRSKTGPRSMARCTVVRLGPEKVARPLRSEARRAALSRAPRYLSAAVGRRGHLRRAEGGRCVLRRGRGLARAAPSRDGGALSASPARLLSLARGRGPALSTPLGRRGGRRSRARRGRRVSSASPSTSRPCSSSVTT